MRRSAIVITLIGLWMLGGAAACNNLRAGVASEEGGDSPDPTPDVGHVSITPATVYLTANGSAQRVSFQATSDHLRDITERASWLLSDDNLGSISQGQLTVSAAVARGGSYKVVASLGNGSGAATVFLKVIAPDVVDPSAPADARDWFSGPGGGPAAQVVYPFDQTMMAPNILQMALQWRDANNQAVFRIHLSGPTYERNFYVGSSLCPSGQCTYDVADKMWSDLGHSSLDQQVTLEVSGVKQKGGPVGTSDPIHILFSPEDCRGGLYYFSPTIGGIKRVPLGASKPVDFIKAGNGTPCTGCHSVSRDGKQVAAGSSIFDGVDPKKRNFPPSPDVSWDFSWFDPTGEKLIANWNGALAVRSTRDGHVLATVSTAQIGSQGASMPEWSPDGRYIAFVRQPIVYSEDWNMSQSGDIVIMPYNDGAFGPAVELVHGRPSAEVHFWPSWSPDSKWLVFNSFACESPCQQYNAKYTRLRIIRAVDDAGKPAIGSTPIELLRGTHLPNLTNNWPKFAPFLQQNRYVFIVYSAGYGWGHFNVGKPQLFMFGLDLERAKMGDDPSFQPIWLPFQEKDAGNHSAIWTTDVACGEDGDCPGEFMCVGNKCTPWIG